MMVVLLALAAAFAALCVWLTVRIVNRRERWAKRTLAAVVGVPVLYVLCFGPACWIGSRSRTGAKIVNSIYQPILRLAFHDPDVFGRGALWYAKFLADGQWTVGYVSGRYEWCKMPL